MRKWVFGLTVLILLVIGAFSQAVMKGPFEQARLLVCSDKGQRVDVGYKWEGRVSINGDQVRYIIGYEISRGVISLIKIEGAQLIALSYVEPQNLYALETFIYGRLMDQQILEEKEAIQKANEYFKELSNHLLL